MKSESAISSMASVELGGELQQPTDTPKVEEQPGVSLEAGVPATKEARPPSPIVVYKQGWNGPMDDKRAEIYQNDLLLGS